MRTFMLGVFPADWPTNLESSMVAARFASVHTGVPWVQFDGYVTSIRLELKRHGRKGKFDLIIYEVGDYIPGTGRKGPNQYPKGCHKGGMPRHIEFVRRITIK